jgi:pimeloyl-ACP methyl ester carboxylesterase
VHSSTRRLLWIRRPAVAGLAAVLFCACSPSTFLARKMTVAPNRAPQFVKPKGRVVLRWPAEILERFPAGTNEVGSPPADVRWLMVEPADYRLSLSSRTWKEDGRVRGEIQLSGRFPREGLPPTRAAVGTAFLVHGYGVDLETMFPWALYLAQEGWRCVLADLRGHGQSGGRRVYYGCVETNDLCELRRELEASGRVHGPYVAIGHSLGGAIALRWQTVDPEIAGSVAFGPLAEFAPAAERLRAEYVSWLPSRWVGRAVKKLPGLLELPPNALDTRAALEGHSVRALLVAGSGDVITPPEDSAMIWPLLEQGSEMIVVGPVTHELLPYLFDQHAVPVRNWLAGVVNGKAGELQAEAVSQENSAARAASAASSALGTSGNGGFGLE